MNTDDTNTKSQAGADSLDRFVRLFTLLCLNCALVWCALEGVVNGNVGAGRVLAFAAWFFAVIYLLASILPKDVTAKTAAKGRAVPALVSHGFDAAMIVFLVWNGWWWTAIAFVLITVAEAGIYHKPNAPG